MKHIRISPVQRRAEKGQDEYVEKPQMKPLTENALKGLAGGVDAFSTYLNPDELQFVRASLEKRRARHRVVSPGRLLPDFAGLARYARREGRPVLQ